MVKPEFFATPLPLTIVVVTFNSAVVIRKCLSSIISAVPVIVVDNGSTDDTIKEIQQVRPDAKIIKNGLNMGYGIANNIGLANIDTEFGMILNPDAVIIENCLEKLTAILNKNPRAACAAPILKSLEGKPEIYVMGPTETHHSRWETDPEGDFCTWFLMGAAVVWRMSAWREIGGFDENFFLYNEDADLCLRTTHAGYAHILSSEAKVVHLGGESAKRTASQSWLRDWQMTWSNLYYQKKLGAKDIRGRAAKLTLWHGIRALIYILFLRPKKVAGECAKFSAAFQFMIGRGAHSKDGVDFLKSHPEAHGKESLSGTYRNKNW